ncbi:MAG TPA: hypothetical protein VET88_10555 [Gammaproteobacteria bacterium]|nr:hypothetical protein [Gammaproteobacteria bacterium]
MRKFTIIFIGLLLTGCGQGDRADNSPPTGDTSGTGVAAIITDPNPGPDPDPIKPEPTPPTPRCVKCARDDNRNFICVKASMGGTECNIDNGTDGRSCTYKTGCSTGLAFPGAVIAFQARINRHFQNDVLPGLRKCWSQIEGRGELVLSHYYDRGDDDNWHFQHIDITETTLPDNQGKHALDCMTTTSRGVAFTAEAGDADDGQMVLHWTWPVPLPDE